MIDTKLFIGKKYNRLTIIEYSKTDKHNNHYFTCICECGKRVTNTSGSLQSGSVKSCGCYNMELRIKRATHGQTSKFTGVTPEYKAWQNMKNRCNNNLLKCFPDYGGRGIRVCERWQNSFENFLQDMGVRPSNRHSLDRFPNANGHYEPENCRWATKKQQQQNTRTNKWFEYNGAKLIISDWARKFDIMPSLIQHHLKTKSFSEIVEFYSKKKNLII